MFLIIQFPFEYRLYYKIQSGRAASDSERFVPRDQNDRTDVLELNLKPSKISIRKQELIFEIVTASSNTFVRSFWTHGTKFEAENSRLVSITNWSYCR